MAEAATRPAHGLSDEERLRLRTSDPGRVRNPRERRARIAVAGLALVGATATLSVVAQSALPGDLLYPLKRGIESAEAGLRVSEQGKGTTLLASATTRLDEVSRLDAEDHPAEIADTLDDFTAQATEASDLLLSSYAAKGDDATVVDLRSFTAESMTSLSDLDGQLPGSAQDEWVHAVTTLMRIDDEAQLACPTCAGTDLDEITPTLPTVGTGFGTGALPALNLPDIVLPSLVLPSLAGDLPPGSVTKPSPTVGPGGGPTAGQPTGDPTSLPTTLPTGVPTTGVPTAGLPTAGLPTGVATSAAVVVPSVDLTQLIDDLTGGPSVLPVDLPSVDVTALLGGVLGSVLPTPVTDPLGDLLDP